MARFVCCAAIALAFPFSSQAQTFPPKGLDLAKLEIDQVGQIPGGDVENFTVTRVVNDKEAAIQAYALMGMIIGGQPTTRFGAWGGPFLLRGVSTRGWVDAKSIKLEDVYRVTGTAKVSGRTVFVLEPASEADRAKAPALEQPAPRSEQKKPAKEKPKAKAPPAAPSPVETTPEQDASRKLKLAKLALDDGQKDVARRRLNEVVQSFPKIKAAEEARELLEKLDKK
jgi:hypothetical protein